VHLGLDTASAVVSAPISPDRSAKVSRRLKSFVSGHRTRGDGLLWFGIFARRDDCVRPVVCDGIVALAGIIGTVCGDARDFLVGRDLVEQVGQDRCVADVASGALDGPNLQRFLINPEVDLALNTPFGTAMLACVPLALTLDLDACAVD
jgi:hypothetical protein